MALFFSRFIVGRVLLHAGCVLRGGCVRHHWAGVRREISSLVYGLRRLGRFAKIGRKAMDLDW